MNNAREVGVRLKVGAEGVENLDRLGRALEKLGVDTEALDRKAEALGAELKTAGAAGSDAALDQDKLAEAAKEAAQAAEQLGTAAKQAAGGTADLAGNSEDAKTRLSNMKVELVAAGAAAYTIGRALGAAGRDAADFETAMAEVGTLLDDTTNLDEQAEAVRRLAREYGGEAPAQAKAYYQIISAGAEQGAEAIGILDQANKLAVGGVTDITTAADGLTSVLNAYGEEAGTAEDVSDALFVAMRAGKTTIGELSASLGQVAPISAQAGVGLTELLAGTAALTKGGVSTSQAITQVRGIISSIIAPTSQASETARNLGLQFDAQALKAKGLAGFLESVKAATGGNTETMATLFGSVEALGGVLALTGNQAGSFSDILEDMETRAGSTDEALAKITGTSAFAGRQFQSALADIRISVGQAITAFTPLLTQVTELLNKFNELEPGTRTLIAGLAGIGGAAVLLAGPLATLAKGAGALAGLLTGKSLAMRAVASAAVPAAGGTATLGAAAAGAAVPIGAAAAATGRLGAALALLLRLTPLGLLAAGLAFVASKFIEWGEGADAAAKASKNLAKDAGEVENASEKLQGAAEEAGKELQALGKQTQYVAESMTDQERAARLAATALGVDLVKGAKNASEEFLRQQNRLLELVEGLDDLAKKGVDTGRVVSEALAKMVQGARNQAELDILKKRIEEIGAAGKLSKTQIEDLMESVDVQARKVGAGLNGLTEAARKAGVSIESLTGGLSQAGAQGVAAVSGLIDEIVKAKVAAEVASPVLAAALLKRVQAAATAEEVAKLREQIDQAASSGKLFGTDLEKALDAVKRKAQELSPAFQQAAEDARRLGIDLSTGLERSAESGLRAYERLKLSGQASAKQIEQAFVNLANEQIKAAEGVVPEWVKVEAALRGAVLKTDEYGKVTVLTFKQAAEEANRAAKATGEIGTQAQSSASQVGKLADNFGRLASGAVSAGNAVRDALQASGGGGFGLLSGDYIANRNASIPTAARSGSDLVASRTASGQVNIPPGYELDAERYNAAVTNNRSNLTVDVRQFLRPTAETAALNAERFAAQQAALGLVPDTRPGFEGGYVRAPGTPTNGGTAAPTAPPFNPTPGSTAAEAALEQSIFATQQLAVQAQLQQQTAQAQLLTQQLAQLQAELAALRAGGDGRLSPSSVIEIRIPRPGDQPLRVFADGPQSANQFAEFLQRALENAFRANGGALSG